ncbi:peptidylprolyl isomerase [bacterium]|nr:peptidylprolyl isomerase [bacterium]
MILFKILFLFIFTEAQNSADWRRIEDENLLYFEFDKGLVIMELAPDFAPEHVKNIKKLANEKYWDGLSIVRVQDNYVVQWGDPNAEKPELKKKIKSAKETLKAEFDRVYSEKLSFTALPDADTYAKEVGFVKGFPVARDKDLQKMWLTHCYAMVGAGRNNPADSGGGAELYVVIGHAPRHLDRNVTLVGRVVQGIELLSSLPRGTGPLGFYEKPEQQIRIQSIRLASQVAKKDRVALEALKTDSETFKKLIAARRHRQEEWFHDSAQRLEICNMMLPVRKVEGKK